MNTNGTIEAITSINVVHDAPSTYALYQNYPNLFNPSTTVQFDLKQLSTITIEIYNVLGQRVLQKNYGNMNAGKFNEVVNLAGFASGAYYYRIIADGVNGEKFTSIKNMMLVK